MQEVTPSAEEQSLVQGLCTKVSTVMENMIVTGDGEELVIKIDSVGCIHVHVSYFGHAVTG